MVLLNFFFGDTSVSPVSAPTPRRLFAPAIRFVAGSSYRVIAISLFPSGRQGDTSIRRYVDTHCSTWNGDTSIRRYVDTSIRRYVDTSILLRIAPRGTALRRYGVTALRRYGVTHCSTWNGVTALRRYGVTALRRYVVLSFSILRKIISQKPGPLFKIGTRPGGPAADPSRRAAGPPGRRAVVTS